MLLIALALMGFIQWLGALPFLNLEVQGFVAVLLPLLTVPLVFALLFKVLPPVRLRWSHVWLASVLCGVGWLISTEILALYGSRFGNLGAYGALGGVLVLMLWMKATSQVLFFGAELCKVVYRRSCESQEPTQW
jgi:membrane protein